ncbi:MAG: transketolase family protein [Clostridia bacterium]
MKKRLMRDILVDFLRDEMTNGDKVVLVEADLAKCSATIPLMDEFPERALNVGVAEQNMASVAAGLASYGFVPFIHSFAPFATRRICDQAMISIAYSKQNVKIIGSDPGITAELNGGTHMPFEDIAIMRSIPQMVVYEATDNVEFSQALPQILQYDGAVYIRMFRKTPPPIYEEDYKFDLFKATVIKEGRDATIVASGIMVSAALKAREELLKEGIDCEVIASPTIKPLDEKTIIASAKKTRAVVTAENHNIYGGLGSAVAECLSENCPTKLKRVGVKDKFGEVGKAAYLSKVFNLEVSDIISAVKEIL